MGKLTVPERYLRIEKIGKEIAELEKLPNPLYKIEPGRGFEQAVISYEKWRQKILDLEQERRNLGGVAVTFYSVVRGLREILNYADSGNPSSYGPSVSVSSLEGRSERSVGSSNSVAGPR